MKKIISIMSLAIMSGCGCGVCDEDKGPVNTTFATFAEAKVFQHDSHNRQNEVVVNGCDYVTWDESNGCVGYLHVGTCRNEIHKCPCDQNK